MTTKKKRKLVRVSKRALESSLRKAVAAAYKALERYARATNYNAAIALVGEEFAKRKRLDEEKIAAEIARNNARWLKRNPPGIPGGVFRKRKG